MAIMKKGLITTADFMLQLSARVGLKPATCRSYLRQAGFVPAGGREGGRQRVRLWWDPSQAAGAEAAIRELQSRRAQDA